MGGGLEPNLCETRYRITTTLGHLFHLFEDESVQIFGRHLIGREHSKPDDADARNCEEFHGRQLNDKWGEWQRGKANVEARMSNDE